MIVTSPAGVFELDLENYKITKGFGQLMTNTKENGAYCQGHLYLGGYQLATYHYKGQELINMEEYLLISQR